jgi:Transglycosylase SLT domain
MRDLRIAKDRLPEQAERSGFACWAEMMAPLVVGLLLGLVPLPPLMPPPNPSPVPVAGQPLLAETTISVPTVQSEPEALSEPLKATKPSPTVTPGPAPATPVLSKEQHHVVDFITRTYQVAADQAGPIVVNAYRAARDAKIDPHLVLAVMSIESRFDSKAKSARGAQGLMQVVTRVHARRFEPFGGIAAAFDPIANIRVGTQILKEYIINAGSAEGGLKGYVGAAGNGDDGGYGSKVLAERAKFAAVAAGRAPATSVSPVAKGQSVRPVQPAQPAAPAQPAQSAPPQLSLESPPVIDRPRAGS